MLKRTTSIQIAVLLGWCVSASPVLAAEQVKTRGSVSIVESASLRVVNEAPLQALLVTGTIAPTGVTFTLSGQDAGSTASLGMPGFVSGGGESIVTTTAGLITGTTINGEALSVSVGSSFGNVSADTNSGANRGISVVIAQYN